MQITVREKIKRISLTRKVIWIVLIVTSIFLLSASLWVVIESSRYFGPVLPAKDLDITTPLLIISVIVVLIAIFGAINTTLSQENILNNHTRAKIYSLIKAQPGVHLSEIIRNLNLGKGQADWHLFNLKRFELIIQVRSKQYLLFYPKDLDGDAFISHSTIFKSKTREQIHDLITTGKATTQNQIKELLQLGQSSIAYHLGILEQESIIYAKKIQGILHYYTLDRTEKN